MKTVKRPKKTRIAGGQEVGPKSLRLRNKRAKVRARGRAKTEFVRGIRKTKIKGLGRRIEDADRKGK